ncbi:MAG: type II secretion system protein [Methylococcales bacterium]|nr:type II secretion system protein [Methylococcales bacterium]
MQISLCRGVKNKNRGFTLIELLVVIAIIGLLATIILVSLNASRTKARDARARGDLRQITNAMALFYDANGAYYATGDTDCDAANEGTAIPANVSIGTFINPVPRNNGDATNGLYYWCNGGASGTQGTQKFCVYVQSAVNTANWFYASEKGAGTNTSSVCP